MGKNIDSIKQMPKAYITDDERATYLALARAGQDVYAYRPSPDGHFNIWWIDTRIALGPLPRRYQSIEVKPLANWYWSLAIQDGQEPPVTITLFVPYRPGRDNTLSAYHERARRALAALVAHLNTFGTESKLVDLSGITWEGI